MNKLLQRAYKKYKSDLYFDKTKIYTRGRLVEFEYGLTNGEYEFVQNLNMNNCASLDVYLDKIFLLIDKGTSDEWTTFCDLIKEKIKATRCQVLLV